MPKNSIEDLRNHLFAALEGLADKDEPMELERAKAVAEVGKILVESAKVEVAFLKVTGALKSTNFLPDGTEVERPTTAPPGRRLNGGAPTQ
jgi:hypothetical protein